MRDERQRGTETKTRLKERVVTIEWKRREKERDIERRHNAHRPSVASQSPLVRAAHGDSSLRLFFCTFASSVTSVVFDRLVVRSPSTFPSAVNLPHLPVADAKLLLINIQRTLLHLASGEPSVTCRFEDVSELNDTPKALCPRC